MRRLHFFLLPVLVAAATTASAQRPPTMGWSSWNTFALNINEALIRQQADAMHTSGLQDAGYRYVNIDDGYWDGRGDDGHLRLNTQRFPSGMRALVDYIHSLGLKAGIYSDAGDNTCGSGNRHAWGLGVGLAGHEDEDCQLYFRDWDFDFIKVDYCGGAHMKLDEREQYTRIAEAIRRCGKKDIVYNMCRWAFPGTWGAAVADSWRTTGDIYDAWKSVRDIIAENLCLSAYCHDGHYNDMDMLEVGRSLTPEEDRTHFGLWCIMASPLLIGCDMAAIRPEALELLCNRDLIALNQDRLHLQAYVAAKLGECYLFVKDIKKLGGRERAFAVYNPTDEEQHVSFPWSTLDMADPVTVHDCFGHTDLPPVRGQFTALVPPHGTRIYTARTPRRLQRRVYEAETAYLSEYQELRNNQAALTAVYTPREGASGGHVAAWLGKRAENDLQWREVCVDKAGLHRLTFTYFGGEDRDMELEVNGSHVVTLHTHSRDWSRPATVALDVRLRKGRNVVRLYNGTDWMPDVDCLTVD